MRSPTLRWTLLPLALLAAGTMFAADWPQFRGPARDGVSAETGLVSTWGEAGPKELWRRPLGVGYSGVSVVGNRLYVMYGADKEALAAALDAATGETIWTSTIGAKWNDNWGDGPRSTPTVDGERVYLLGGRGNLVALATKDGSRLWSRDLTAEYGAKPPRWGVSTSPLIEGGNLIVDVGGSGGVVAFDQKTGEEVWKAPHDQAGYSAPIVAEIGGKRQLIAFTGTQVSGVSPADGKILWEFPWKTSYDVNAATPIFVAPDRVFVSSAYDVGAAVLVLAKNEAGFKATPVWKNRELKNKFSSSVLHDGHLYGFDEKTLKCVDVATGETRWRARGLGHGSLIYADGKLIILGAEGDLLLAEASPEAFRETARYQVFDSRCWTAPALAGGHLYLRDQAEIAAFDLKQE